LKWTSTAQFLSIPRRGAAAPTEFWRPRAALALALLGDLALDRSIDRLPLVATFLWRLV
jgi:hypothetical protein